MVFVPSHERTGIKKRRVNKKFGNWFRKKEKNDVQKYEVVLVGSYLVCFSNGRSHDIDTHCFRFLAGRD